MNGWILGIVGIVLIGVLVEIILPSGKTNVFIKSIFSLIFIFVVISPVLKVLEKTDLVDFSEIFNTISTDDETEHQILELEYKIEEKLLQNGIFNANINVVGYSTKSELIIEKIKIDLSDLIINKEDEHIDKYKLITELIISVANVQEEQIVYG